MDLSDFATGCQSRAVVIVVVFVVFVDFNQPISIQANMATFYSRKLIPVDFKNTFFLVFSRGKHFINNELFCTRALREKNDLILKQAE